MSIPGLIEQFTFPVNARSSTISALTRNRLLNIQPAAILPLHRNACCVNRLDLPYRRLLQLLVLPAHPYQVHHPARTPTDALLPTQHLEVVRYACRILVYVAGVLVRLTSFPDSLLELSLTLGYDSCQQCRRIWQRNISSVLDAQLRRYVRARSCLRECRHGRRSALDSSVADLLGDHQRQQPPSAQSSCPHDSSTGAGRGRCNRL